MNNKYLLTLVMILLTNVLFSQAIILQPGPSGGKDSRIFNMPCGVTAVGCDTTNYGNDTYFQANAWTWSSSPAIMRSFIEFDLSSAPLKPLNVTSATLYLYFPPEQITYESQSTLSGSNSVNVDRVIQSWTENGIRWVNQPNVVTTSLTNLENRVTIPATTSATQDITINLTDMVKYWLTNPTQNYGVRLALATEQNYRRMTFASSDHAIDSIRPKLVINYTFNSGLKESNENINFNVFPNPVKGIINVQTIGSRDKVTFEISGLDGKRIFFQSFDNTSNTIIIPVNSIGAGLYLMKVTDESANQKTRKISIIN